MDINWKGPDGTGCYYANVFKEPPYRGFLCNILAPQCDEGVWGHYGVLKQLKEDAHPTEYEAFVADREIGRAPTLEAAKALVASALETM